MRLNGDETLCTLREMILNGELTPEMRITEAYLADLLGVSRTPVRNALPALAAEGFLEPVGKRGYAVKAFSEQDCEEALQLRSAFEGLAARRLAETGASPEVFAALEACLREGDEIFVKLQLEAEDEERYRQMNANFHSVIADNCGSDLLRSFIARLNMVPFVAPSAVSFEEVGVNAAFTILFRAHGVHHAIVEAIRDRDGSRAESLFREHAHQQVISMLIRSRQKAEAASG